MKLRGGDARRDEQPDGGELESWIADLAGGETSVRRLRERLDAAGSAAAGSCSVCARAASHAEHAGHEQDRLTA
jgi:hypothetical protein